ncbi:pyroglutamyl-peptidase [Sediminihabitans luteus]|uniref:Pyrrolidone-carboxylate peptidase n=1 Tax=Sediminihabitans luteus TaxID=1138585 RepID=A0A2M9CR24_9CELL|nr:pyroglutamyl-peptidase I [Sediminihabitans luteus]PJJ74337.1 pyroglutamyl-peptidase [Sediminihabitans luteus]GIJ00449.1 pyrrolidone-carboxylate peptidase [Sediminihabitans luteus]
MTILVSGFEPFDDAATNPSWDAARALAASWPALGHAEELHAVRLPVTFDGAWPALRAAIEEHSPRVVVAAGLAGGTQHLRVERVAINLADARIPDNAGASPREEPVVDGGPVGLWTDLPVRGTLALLRERGVPARASTTAGTYVCNALFYALQHATPSTVRSGFVHVPADDAGGLPLEVTVAGLRAVVEAAAGLVALPADDVTSGTES